jgi:hypothetical protein
MMISNFLIQSKIDMQGRLFQFNLPKQSEWNNIEE